MAELAHFLSASLALPVSDHTGLSGVFNISLRASADDRVNDAGAKESPGSEPDPSAPSIFTALREQVGLKLPDSGMLSPEIAAGIRRVKGPKNLGVRLGNWLTAEQARTLMQVPNCATLKGERDRALIAVLLGCGLRRREAAELDLADLQRREDHWAIVDLVGKGRHVRTVPVPEWVKAAIDSWLASAEITRLFRVRLPCGKNLG